MFELFFKYPFEAFSRGEVVLLGRWPVWLLGILLLAGAAAFAWPLLRDRRFNARPLVVWTLQTATLGMLLLMLWQPALITDDKGIADLAVNFADSITTWRLSAR